MQLLQKVLYPILLFLKAIPPQKSKRKVIFALTIIFVTLLTIFDFLLPRETITTRVYDQQTLDYGGNEVLLWSDYTASFSIDMGDSAYVLSDKELFVFRTKLLKRIDPVVMLNEDMIFPVVYTIRSSYFMFPIGLILLCLFLIFNRFDKTEEGLVDPFCFLFIFLLTVANFAMYFNPFLQFYFGKSHYW